MKRLSKLALLIPLLLPLGLSGQAVRWTGDVYTINTSAPLPGALYPVLANTSATVAICTYSSSGALCPATVTTYTDATEGTSCTAQAQLTPPDSSGCTASVNADGTFGVWIAPGTYQYVVTNASGTFGPYPFTVGGTGGGGSGTVTSVALTVPSRQTVTGSPITSSGTFAITDNTQSANQVFAGPTTGSAAAPAFRALVPADLPVGSSSQIGGLQCGSGTTCIAGVISATAGAPAFSAITSGTNNSAQTLIVGSTSTLTFGGTGVLNASQINGITVTGTPSTGQVITATSPTAANWQTPSGGGGSAFSAITSGTNSGQTLVVGATSTLAPASTGTITANIITGTIVAGTNISISGAGTVLSPYSISASGTGIGGSGTANAMAKFTASATIGNSLLTDDATTLTYSGTGGLSLTGTSHFMTIAEQAAPANPSAGSERIYADSTTHLLSCLTSTGSSCMPSGGGGGGTALLVASAEVVTFSATPTFSTAVNVSRIVLTGNITSFTLGAGSDGQLKTLCFKQGSGAYTVTPPAGVHGFFSVGTISGDWNCQAFSYDNTDSIWLAQNTGIINQ